MSGTNTAKAPNVCLACKARKRRCDKSLPRCHFCAHRDRVCRYQYSTFDGRQRSVGAPVRSSPSRRSSSSFGTNDDACSASNSTRNAHGQPVPPMSRDQTIQGSLCVEARRLLDITGLYLDEITIRYFQGIGTFVPMVDRARFQSQLLASEPYPQPDFALLLACMGLVISSDKLPSRPRQDETFLGQDITLYAATKALMAHVQALCPPTTRLVQAGVLISVYEYAHGYPDRAFVTIGTCARMAYAAGLRSAPALTSPMSSQTEWDSVEEEINTWWTICICDRTYLCDVKVMDQPLGSVMPSGGSRLPLEYQDFRALAWMGSIAGVAVEDLDSPKVGSFGRASQAAWLLDDVLQGMSMKDPDRKQAHLIECDRRLQEFLATLMQQSGGDSRMFCVSIALTFRTLFLLHETLLELNARERASDDGQIRISQSALDTVTKMVIDTAATHEHVALTEVDRLPPSFMYVIRAALKHIQHSQSTTPDPQLLASLKQFEARWGASSGSILSTRDAQNCGFILSI
ncbi:uncharacterized protein BP01DRAFT_142088 [Aspergillus saccharolyticus JOP 1030-1]|uniref:Zn(2)-C6 fungal-type domain-containing protein n=1 Tax=Aspergillus saccharolyticus JOP 1030-1 TaxID=1450539 RepID=A0A318Z487_9EURO|nr:hypothetical protein BP01DRAFT_142088 [Aspergillus saccharolyticus JOP 1030-1]PYH42141.1 hypothetical protein BP01DRAFT_142088 [Aspergillus saccharolyticus JOP 1030-1]